MAERPVPLSPAALRLAGHVGQTALERATASGVSAVAKLDQHIAAVRAGIAACQQVPGAQAAKPSRAATHDGSGSTDCPCCGARAGRRGRLGLRRRGSGNGRARQPGQVGQSGGGTDGAGAPCSGEETCPDVPFVASALHAEATLPLELLLHYTCGFVQAALSDGWIPEASADASDWVSLRLAAICQLIRQAEAAAAIHPDLRASA